MTSSFTNFPVFLAQLEADAVVSPTEDGVSALSLVIDFFSAGGIFMPLILLCSIIAIAVIAYKAIVMRTARVLPPGVDGILASADQYVAAGDTDQFFANLNAYDSPLTRPAAHALGGGFVTEDAATSAAESMAREEVVRLHTGMPVLEVVITIAPLLGLLGTVSGLVSVFGTLGGSQIGDADPALLARGIAMALNTTIAGLAVAVPTVVAHTYFSRKIEKMAARMEVVLGSGISSYFGEVHRQSLAEYPTPTAE